MHLLITSLFLLPARVCGVSERIARFMAEETGTAVVDAPSVVDSPAPVVEAVPVTPPAPAPTPVPPVVAEPPVAPRPEPPTQRTPTPEPRPPAPEPSPPQDPTQPTSDPKEGATDATDTLLNWRDLADPDIRNAPSLKKYKTIGEALKGLVHLSQYMDSSIQIPREGAGDAQWRVIWEKLGCPKSPSDYTIADPPMGQDEQGHARTLAPNFLVSLLDAAHVAGLTQKQAQAFVDFAARTVVQSENIQAGELAMQKAAAERELFEAFAGDAATMIQKAVMAMSRMGEGRYGGGAYAQRAAEKIRASHLGNDVDVIAMFANVWDNFSEGQFIEGSDGSMSSIDQIQADITAFGSIMNDQSKPLDERRAAQQKQLQRYQDLIALQEAAARRQNGFRR